ncbi:MULTISPECIES: BTAD domain-containing putative transcriptional regulator [unclassified Streptomyces]|uniref:BTAD domain-containing putative transcriptional regulator n=1 Tax=unclassified Streptomyces TaxID=2593676 RepID=UPI0022575146|nr:MULTISPECIES: BTAD domain-containing putative transcriptional regulator [unclassified Streptomyces]MCX5333837.1 winged helix-turn-helix domain-containing protein [Streptomyces sp. NBC_00140]MCX5363325.1 winged helix-turn-helix domain-containing protein [Streptomyces sp. NBC_00124]
MFRVDLLGSVRVHGGDGSVDIGGARLRMLLARLALEAGRPVSVDSLVDGLWGEQPPADAANALQALVSRLRKALRGTGTVDAVAGGYRLSVQEEDVDTYRFEDLAGRGRHALAAGRTEEAARTLTAALGLWRGEALADVLEAPFAGAAATRLDELRAAAVEDRFDAELRAGRYADVLADLEAAGARQPLSERLAGLRMRALSAAGRQSDALAVYEDLRGRLGDELGVDPSAEVREIHLALLRGELERPAARPTNAPSRLPARLTSFVGRDGELDRLADLMGSARLVTLVGPGGAGKTRLSLEAATRDTAHARDRVRFVPLAGVSRLDQLADVVLGALSSTDGRLYEGGGAQQASAVERTAELLGSGDTLLLIDNCEHVVEAVAELADQLLVRLPELRILATSREPLAINGESLFHLGPLDVPTGSPEPAEAMAAAAVRLFVDRAAGVRQEFALDESNLDAVLEICRRLDGMPLALELAAAKLRSMGVDQIARRLDDRFRLLSSGSRTALPRQRTLLAMVEWSWDLLDEPERILARRLSAFPGGATLAALETVCSDPQLPADDVLYVLGALIEKSLVQEVRDADGEPRYRMLDTVRAYAARRLAESGDDLTARFTAYHLALAQRHEPLLRTGAQLRATAVFDSEHDNLTHALRLVRDAGDRETAVRFGAAMFWYWGIRGMGSRLETHLAAVADSAAGPAALGGDSAVDREFHPAGLLLRMSQVAFGGSSPTTDDLLASSDPWVRASAHLARDFALTEQGDLETGVPSRIEALRGFEAVGDRWGIVLALMPIGRDHSLRGEHASAIATFERAVVLSSELGTEDYLYLSKARLARERRRSGDLDGAFRDLRAAHRQARERGQLRLEANILVGLANAHRMSGDVDQANRTLDHLEALSRRRPDLAELAHDLVVSTRVENHLAEGRASEARALLPRAAGALFGQGAGAGLAWVAELLGGLRTLEGDPTAGATAFGISEVMRGAFDAGEPELQGHRRRMVEALGEEGYRTAYGTGATMPRAEARDWLEREALGVRAVQAPVRVE